MQRFMVVSQMRPDEVPPQSESTPHPQNAGIEGEGCSHAVPSGFDAQAVAGPVPGVQSTQRLVMVLHAGASPVHAAAMVPVHWTHAPEAAQAGVPPLHSLSIPQPRHMLLVGSQIGVVPLQSMLLLQPTQTFIVVLHTGVAPPQSVLARHWTRVNPFGADCGPGAVPTSTAAVAVCIPTGTGPGTMNE